MGLRGVWAATGLFLIVVSECGGSTSDTSVADATVDTQDAAREAYSASGGGTLTDARVPGGGDATRDAWAVDVAIAGDAREVDATTADTGGSDAGQCSPGECIAETDASEPCGTNRGICKPGTRTRHCSSACAWGPWSACGGTYVGPSPEVCGNQLDDNCDGVVDDGCSCSPVSVGKAGSFAITGSGILKLMASPSQCFVYALTPTQVIVFDTGYKEEVARINLPDEATDMVVSADGTTALVALDRAHEIAIVDFGLRTVARTISVTSDPYAVAFGPSGTAVYANRNDFCDLRRVSLAVGASSDVLLASWLASSPDIEGTPDGSLLYVGEALISDGLLSKYDVTGATAQGLDQCGWIDGTGFPSPKRQLYLSPSATHIYYAGYQVDATDLKVVRGRTGEQIFTEDAASTFAIGQNSVFDAILVRKVARLPQTASAAALAVADRELWYYAIDGRVHYANVNDFLAGVTLGQRELPVLGASSYVISRLVRDPARAYLYGLDAPKQVVVQFDAVTFQPLAAQFVASSPTDLAIDSTSSALFVGHLDMVGIERIRLADFQYERTVPTKRIPYQLAAFGSARMAYIDQDQWTTPTIIDSTSGAELGAYTYLFEGAIGTTALADTLFVGESSGSDSNLYKLALSAGFLRRVDVTAQFNGFSYPSRGVVVVPDGSGVFYAGYLIDGTDLSVLKYKAAEMPISVTPDGRLALSATTVYRVADGTAAGVLSPSGGVQAISPDGKTLYVATASGIVAQDIGKF